VILVMLKVMALRLWRDRAGLILAFLLPPVVFIVFASVFGAGASGRLEVRAGVVDQVASGDSRRLVATLKQRLDGRIVTFAAPAALQDAVAAGQVDAGLVIRGDLAAGDAPVTVLIHPGRRAAGEVLTAQVNAAAAQGLPDLSLRRQASSLGPVLALTPQQAARLMQSPLSRRPPSPLVVQTVLPGGDPLVIYYAGAVSILFLMFTAMQGAISLIDERAAGLRLRLGLSAGGAGALLGGRMIWLTGLGVAQALVLFAVAAAVYGVPLWTRFAPWSVTAVCAAAASAGLALCLAAACRTREQAQTVSTFVILILAAVGGSMAPRFLMPASLQALGWLTPHAWVIEAYQTILWRRVVDWSVLEAWLVLAGFGAVGFAAALKIESRRRL
jgi:ABC-2 type transport system permease protein